MIRYRAPFFYGDEIRMGQGIPIPVQSEWQSLSHPLVVLEVMGHDFDGVEFDWPPRLTLEQQQLIVHDHYFRHFAAFIANRNPERVLDLVPRPIRQRLYREAA